MSMTALPSAHQASKGAYHQQLLQGSDSSTVAVQTSALGSPRYAREVGRPQAVAGRRSLWRVLWLVVVTLLLASACADGTPESASVSEARPSGSGTQAPSLSYVAFGDSWPEGAHCNGCITFAGLWANDLETETGKDIVFTDLTGAKEGNAVDGKTSASLLGSLTTVDSIREVVRDADIVLIATGPNEFGQIHEALQAGTCGGSDQFDCIRALGTEWATNFEAILAEIDTLRAGKPTVVRIVNAANFFLSDPEVNSGLPDNFPTTGGALMFQVLTDAVCDAAVAHQAKCIDVRPILNGPGLDQTVDENSPASMRAVADALTATGLPELE